MIFSVFVVCMTFLPYFREKGFNDMGIVDMGSVFLFFVIIFYFSFHLNKKENEKNK